MNEDDKAAYLKRLKLDAEAPSVEGLFRLHRAHVENVAYETVWLHVGQQWGIDPQDSVERVAHQGRGGYCFQVNGAFSELLDALGYQVTRHLGGVHGPDGPTAEGMGNHLVLTVAGLPTDENPDGVWYVDAGLGDALHEPLQLIAGEYSQGPFTYTLTETPGAIGDWHFDHDPQGSFVGMSWWSAPAAIADFEPHHERLSTAPDSLFVQYLIVQRRDAEGVDIMVGVGLRRVDGNRGSKPRAITDRDVWLAELRDRFGLDLDGVDPKAIDRVWAKNLAAHRAHEESRAAAKRQ